MFICFLIDVIGIYLSMLVSSTVAHGPCGSSPSAMRTLSFVAPLDVRPHPRCHYQWLLGPAKVPAHLKSLYFTCPLQLLTGNALDQYLPGLFCQTRTPGTTTYGLSVPSANEFAFSPSHARKVPLVSLVSDPSGLSGLICFSARLGPY